MERGGNKQKFQKKEETSWRNLPKPKDKDPMKALNSIRQSKTEQEVLNIVLPLILNFDGKQHNFS